MASLARVLYDSVNNRVAAFIDDSGTSLLAIAGKLRNAAGTIVNPATEDTLSSADSWLGLIDTTLDSIKDTDGIKKITDALPVGDNIIGRVKLTDGTHVLLLKAEGDSWTTDYGLPVVSRDTSNTVRKLLSEPDGALIVASRFPAAPPGTTPFTLAVDDANLNVGAGGDVSSPHTTLGPIIGNGVNVYVQEIGVGTEGDSTENGSVVEVYWREGAGPTDHLIDRLYVMGETVDVHLPNVNSARDGTALAGNGTNTRLAVVRKRLSLAALEIDFVIRGYTV